MYDALTRLAATLSDGFIISHITTEEVISRAFVLPNITQQTPQPVPVSLDDIENELIKRFKKQLQYFIDSD